MSNTTTNPTKYHYYTCEHCQHASILNSEEFGTAETCSYCGLSVFISPEEVITEHITITQQMLDDMHAWYEEYMEDMKAEHALNALENQSYEQ